MEVLTLRMQRWYFQWQQSRYGQRWVVIMLAVWVLLAGLMIQAYWHQQQLQHAMQKIPATTQLAVKRNLSPASNASSVLQQWPVEDEAEHISADILAQADAMGMIFERAEFQSLPVEHATLQIQRIKLPLKGDYLQVRQFLSQVLQTYPSLALSQFKLQRSDVMQTGVEAYVEFSLYTRKRAHT
jgi:Tfp pilus assembly protein PilO